MTVRICALIIGSFTLLSCAHRSVLPDVKEVKVGREEAGEGCKELGSITGNTSSAHGNEQQALEDLKREAAHKGANYVRVKQYSAYGTSVVGIAYECP